MHMYVCVCEVNSEKGKVGLMVRGEGKGREVAGSNLLLTETNNTNN